VAGMSDLALWYLGRGTGVMALVLLTAAVVAGVLTWSGQTVAGVPRFVVAIVHRNAGLVATVLLIVHIGTLLLDPYAQLSIVDTLVPFVGTDRPVWLGLGTAAFDLLLAVLVTSLLRHRIGLRSWRAVHWFAYAAWPLALVHAIGVGSDTGQWWLRVLAGLCFITVATAAAARFGGRDQEVLT
jgi:sulfoxide reductase heme-binding subunit YedZ